jgi:exonuclease V gamma subunit
MAAEDDDENVDFGMDLIDGEIDIDTNLAIEKYSNVQTVYAIGSQFHEDEDNPLFLIKNDKLAENVLVLKYVSDDENDNETENIPVLDKLVVKT